MRGRRSMLRGAFIIALVTASTAEAQTVWRQTVWRVPTTIGYGSFGAAVGLLAVHRTGYGFDALGPVARATGAGAVIGVVSGYRLGRSADTRLGRGNTFGVDPV